jgi:hypothetical protein
MDKKDGKPHLGDVAPVVGICLVTTLVALIIAILMNAHVIIIIALAGVLAALAFRIRQESS